MMSQSIFLHAQQKESSQLIPSYFTDKKIVFKWLKILLTVKMSRKSNHGESCGA